MWTPPWLASLTSYRGRWQSGQVRSYVRPLDAALMAAGPYGVREIGSKSKRRALWPIEAYWFFRPRLVVESGAGAVPLGSGVYDPPAFAAVPSPIPLGPFPAPARRTGRKVGGLAPYAPRRKVISCRHDEPPSHS